MSRNCAGPLPGRSGAVLKTVSRETTRSRGAVEQRECASDENDDEDNLRAGNDSSWHCHHGLCRADGRWGRLRVRSRDHDFATRGRILMSLVLSRRKHPREQCRYCDATEQENQRMWETQAHLTSGVVANVAGRLPMGEKWLPLNLGRLDILDVKYCGPILP